MATDTLLPNSHTGGEVITENNDKTKVWLISQRESEVIIIHKCNTNATVFWDILVSSYFRHFGSDGYSFILASLILATCKPY